MELGVRGPRKANGNYPEWDFPVKTPLSNAGDVDSIPDRGTKTPHATGCGQKKKVFFFF